MKKLSLEEKIRQISCQMEYPIRGDYEQKRKYNLGNYRNLGHFLHESKGKPLPTEEIAKAINNDIKRCMESNPHSIPPIEHGEALHSAQWGMATCFPQPIAMASMFDKEMVEEIAPCAMPQYISLHLSKAKEWTARTFVFPVSDKPYRKTTMQ